MGSDPQRETRATAAVSSERSDRKQERGCGVTHHPQSKKRSDFIPAADLRRIARGRWREILVAAGVPAHALDGRRGRPCPKCGGRDRFTPMKDLDDRGAVLCRHCHNASTDPKCGDGISSL
ncbi:MAG: hypothetical protein KGQ60_10480, partial [Planctomycetes bacterium]|nr:hypothetical protein [Planctomycetota bacterium]